MVIQETTVELEPMNEPILMAEEQDDIPDLVEEIWTSKPQDDSNIKSGDYNMDMDLLDPFEDI